MSKVIWCNSWQFPYSYGFCPDDTAFRREMKLLGVKRWTYPSDAANCSHVIGSDCSIVTVSVNPDRTPQQVVELLVHEATHVYRALMKRLGERKPSAEFQAYTIQTIASELISAYTKTRGPLFHKGKTK